MSHDIKQLYKQKLQNACEDLTNSIDSHYVPVNAVFLQQAWKTNGTLVWTAEEEHVI